MVFEITTFHCKGKHILQRLEEAFVYDYKHKYHPLYGLGIIITGDS